MAEELSKHTHRIAVQVEDPTTDKEVCGYCEKDDTKLIREVGKMTSYPGCLYLCNHCGSHFIAVSDFDLPINESEELMEKGPVEISFNLKEVADIVMAESY